MGYVEDDTETVIPESKYEPVYIQADVPPKNASGDYLEWYKKQKEQEEQEAILGVTSMPMETICWILLEVWRIRPFSQQLYGKQGHALEG